MSLSCLVLVSVHPSTGCPRELSGSSSISRVGNVANTSFRRCLEDAAMANAKKVAAQSKTKTKSKRRWVAGVTTDSTHPRPGLFTKKASAIASALASKRVSPKGPSSGMRMLTYFINRGGRGLSSSRRAELEKAKALLSKKIQGKKRSAEQKAA